MSTIKTNLEHGVAGLWERGGAPSYVVIVTEDRLEDRREQGCDGADQQLFGARS